MYPIITNGWPRLNLKVQVCIFFFQRRNFVSGKRQFAFNVAHLRYVLHDEDDDDDEEEEEEEEEEDEDRGGEGDSRTDCLIICV